jgi:hypothetical protein
MLFSAAILATAAAVAPPRIELDLSAMNNAYKLASSVVRSHDLGYQQTNGAAVMSRQDWTEKCPAATDGSTNPTTCPFPSAAAYDHQDSVVDVTTRVKLVDEDGSAMDVDVNQVNFAKRSTYLFRYDAHDAAGNRAEQVIFALILDDTTAPTISMCDGVAETVEAASYLPGGTLGVDGWKLCAGSVAADNIDSLSAASITYTIQEVSNNVGGAYLCQDAAYAVAVTKIDTDTVGQYLVTLCAHDDAGLYGTNSADNNYCTTKAIEVKDTREPVINIHGADPMTHECVLTSKVSAAYPAYAEPSPAGATVVDLLDTTANGLTIAATAVSTVDSSVVGDYTVKYDASDAAGNPAVQQTREVKVSDTTKPVIDLAGVTAVTHYSSSTFTDTPPTCSDLCDPTPTFSAMSWDQAVGPDTDDTTVGEYIRTYTCCDAESNCQTAERKFSVIDNSQPVITITGDALETYEASRDVTYTDDGATCADYVDGVLSSSVEVSGQVVNMRIPGTYVIRYDCQDLAGNQAVPENRTVYVQDTTCPVVTMLGVSPLYIEAGFNYVDAGATATDDLDGDITSSITTDGDTVNTASAFYSRRSCREIKSAYSAAGDGVYQITTYVAATSQFTRVTVWCDMTSGVGNTYYAVVCGTRVEPYSTAVQGDCANVGLNMAIFDTSSAQYTAAYNHFHEAGLPAHSMYFPSAGATTDNYLCSTNDATAADLSTVNHNGAIADQVTWQQQTNTISHDAISRAEAGLYVIFYHVVDNANNDECATHKRTVVVRDTLPPVITLHLKKQLIHVSAHDQTGVNGEANPAGSAAAGGNPFLLNTYEGATAPGNSFMAEQAQTSSVNGWVIGAVASAVSGLALLANTLRKTDAAVSVPV